MIKQLPSQQRLQELFYYENGVLFHKKSRSKGKANKPIGWQEKNGYWATNVDDVRYRVHRLVYQFHHGVCPATLDHIDGNKSNNAIENLRPATNKQNLANRKTIKTNKLGLKGVCFERNKYKANIKISLIRTRIGFLKSLF